MKLTYIIITYMLLNPCRLLAQNDIIPGVLIKTGAGINGGEVIATGMAIGKDGSMYEVGSFTNTADFEPGPHTLNLYNGGGFMAKYDLAKKLIWAEGIGGQVYIKAAVTDKFNNLYITGAFFYVADFDPGADSALLHCNSESDMFFAKYDSNGKLLFAKQITGYGYQQANAIALDADNNIYVAGFFQGSNADFDPGPGIAILAHNYLEDVFFAKYDTDGNYVFAKAISGNRREIATGLAIDKDRNILITGNASTSLTDFDPDTSVVNLQLHGNDDIFFAKYDSAGKYIFAAAIGGRVDDYSNGITTDENGNILITGQFQGVGVDFDPLPGEDHVARKKSNGGFDIFLAKYASDGSFLFVNTIGGSRDDAGNTITNGEEGSIYIAGSFSGKKVDFNSGTGVDTMSATGTSDLFFAKYDASGKYVYAKQVSGTQSGSAAALLVYKKQVLLAGIFHGIIDVDPGPVVKNFASGLRNSFIAAYNVDGELRIAFAANNYRSFELETYVAGITHDKQRNTYVTGQYEGTIDFDPGPGTYYLTSASNASIKDESSKFGDIFFAKYSPDGKLIFAKSISGRHGEAPNSIELDGDNNIYLCGEFEDSVDFDPGNKVFLLWPDAGDEQANFFAKYDSAGNFVFVKKIQMTNPYGHGIYDIAIDKQKNIFITGIFHEADFDPGPGIVKITAPGNVAIFFAGYDSLGNFGYVNQIGQPGTGIMYGHDIKVSPQGNLILTGIYSAPGVDFDPGPGTYLLNSGQGPSHFIAGYTRQGDFLFASSVTTYKNSFTEPAKLALDKQGNIYVTGRLNGKIDFDPGPDSMIVFAKKGNDDMFFQKYDASGKYVFTKTIATQTYSNGDHVSNSIYVDDYNDIYLTGSIFDTIDFDPGAGVAYIGKPDENGYSSNSIFLAKYDNSGNYKYAYAFIEVGQNARYNDGKDLYVNGYGDVVLAGQTPSTMNVGISGDTVLFEPLYPEGNFFIMQYHQPGFCAIADSLFTTAITSTAATLQWRYPDTATGFKIVFRPVGTTGWTPAKSAGYNLYKRINSLLPGTTYEWKISAGCSLDSSGYSYTSYFTTSTTGVSSAVKNLNSSIKDMQVIVYPNPSKGKFKLRFEGNKTDLSFIVMDGSGKVIYRQALGPYSKITDLDLGNTATGIYLLEVYDGINTWHTKLVIEK